MRHTKPPQMGEFNVSTLNTVQSHSSAFCSNIQFECCLKFSFAPHFVLFLSVVLHLFWLIYLRNRFDWHFVLQIGLCFSLAKSNNGQQKKGTSLHMLIVDCLHRQKKKKKPQLYWWWWGQLWVWWWYDRGVINIPLLLFNSYR